VDDLLLMEKNIIITTCKLERIFPPRFFNSMDHLTIHLPYEARVGGPVQYDGCIHLKGSCLVVLIYSILYLIYGFGG